MAATSYRPDIDGLCAVAVLAVVLHHLSASLVPGGYVGVDVFFVISGYLIISIICHEIKEKASSLRASAFVVNKLQLIFNFIK